VQELLRPPPSLSSPTGRLTLSSTQVTPPFSLSDGFVHPSRKGGRMTI